MGSNEINGKHIFLSCSQRDVWKARLISKALQWQGCLVFLETNQRSGELSSQEIAKKIKECQAFICLLTKEYGKSRSCVRQFRYAVEKCGKRVIPVYLGDKEAIAETLPQEIESAASCMNCFAIRGFKDMQDFLNNVELEACNNTIPASTVKNKKNLKPVWIAAIFTLFLIGFGIGTTSKDMANGRTSSFQDDQKAEIQGGDEEPEEGEIVTFGKYWQEEDEMTDLEWIVLARQDDEMLLLSKYIIDLQAYNSSWEATTWEECPIRDWLNDSFYNTAFTEVEKNVIQEKHLEAHENTLFDVDPGNATDDRVFLLSLQEANDLVPNNKTRKGETTSYAIRKFPDNDKFYWWLRTPGMTTEFACAVLENGHTYPIGFMVGSNLIGVRPAIWVKIAY